MPAQLEIEYWALVGSHNLWTGYGYGYEDMLKSGGCPLAIHLNGL